MEKELFKIGLILLLLVVEARTDGCIDGTDSKLIKFYGVLGVVPITCVDDPNNSDESNSSADVIDRLVDAFLAGNDDGDHHGQSKSGIKNEVDDVPNELHLWVSNGFIKSDKPNAGVTKQPASFELPVNLPVTPSHIAVIPVANNTDSPDFKSSHSQSDPMTDPKKPGGRDFKSVNPQIALGDPTIKVHIPGPAHLNFKKPFTLCFDLKYLPANQTITSMMQDKLDDVPMPLVIAEKDDKVYTNYARFWKSAS